MGDALVRRHDQGRRMSNAAQLIGLLILALGLVAWMIVRWIDENKEDDQ